MAEVLEEKLIESKSSQRSMPAWYVNFFWNSYCEDWPQYGKKNDPEAEKRLPTLKLALKMDPDLLKHSERKTELTNREKFGNLKFLASVFGLTAQIAALMSLAKQFTSGVKNQNIKRVGQTNFDIASSILLYTPLSFALMIPFMYNTKRSLDAFYECLSKGFLLDFPESLKPSFFMSHVVGSFYVLGILTYFVFSALMFLTFEAEITIWIIFVNNVCFGLALYWVDHFCLENKLISLSDFIQGVDDRGKDACIDKYTLTKASDALKKLVPLRTRCSYKEYTSINVFGTDSKKLWLVRACVFLGMAVLAAAMYGIFALTANVEDQTLWTQQISPCAQVCFDHSNREASSCFNCMCDCATAFGTQFVQSYCADWLSVPGCSSEIACALVTNQTCAGRSV